MLILASKIQSSHPFVEGVAQGFFFSGQFASRRTARTDRSEFESEDDVINFDFGPRFDGTKEGFCLSGLESGDSCISSVSGSKTVPVDNQIEAKGTAQPLYGGIITHRDFNLQDVTRSLEGMGLESSLNSNVAFPIQKSGSISKIRTFHSWNRTVGTRGSQAGSETSFLSPNNNGSLRAPGDCNWYRQPMI